MKKSYILTPEYNIESNNDGQYHKVALSVMAAVAMGAKITKVLTNGDVLVALNDQTFFITEVIDHPNLAKLSKEYDGANWFNPFVSKPIAQELMRRFPMSVNPVVLRYGALAAEWVTESNTQFAAGIPHMAGLLSGSDAWCVATSENLLEAITMNALYQFGLERQAVFYFPAGENSGELLYMTPGTIDAILRDPQLAATTIRAAELDKYVVVGVDAETLAFELQTAKLTWQIQMSRWCKETGQPILSFNVKMLDEEEPEEVDPAPENLPEDKQPQH